MSFRNAESHACGEADLIVLRSPDGEKWTEAHRVNALPDDRDPQFLSTENRLFLYDPALQGPGLLKEQRRRRRPEVCSGCWFCARCLAIGELKFAT